MMKIKFIIIIVLGITSFVYNFLNGDLFSLIKDTDYTSLIQAHIGFTSDDNYVGIMFDYIISFIFNINIKDLSGILKNFGG